jgi:hypothetical protein
MNLNLAVNPEQNGMQAAELPHKLSIPLSNREIITTLGTHTFPRRLWFVPEILTINQ